MSEHRSCVVEGVKAQRNIELRLGKKTAQGTADLYGFEASSIDHPACKPVQHFRQRRAERDLNQSRLLDASPQLQCDRAF